MISTSLPVVCVHEDRADFLPGVKLIILSLALHSPGFKVVVSSPGASADFLDWVKLQPNAQFASFRNIQGSGWNIKPSVLLEMLDVYDDVMWIDSDVIVTGDISVFFSKLDTSLLVATEETYWGQKQGGDFRTVAWGLARGRTLPSTVNSGVLRVTRSHVPLLHAWQSMLLHPLYLHAQALPWYERPLHMIGDQEALTALLGATDFSYLPIKLLRRGADIAQCFGPAGFTPMERLRALFGSKPSFVHAMGPKPWLRDELPPSPFQVRGFLLALRNWYRYLSLDTSPYCTAARPYSRTSDMDLRWTRPKSALGKLFTTLGGDLFAAPGLPVAIVDHLVRRLRRVLGIARYTQSAEFVLTERPF